MRPHLMPIALLALLYFGPGLFYFSVTCTAVAADLGSVAQLTEADEPGERLRVTGTVYGTDGETPVAGVELYVYHTDARGYYAEDDVMGNDHPRLNARLITDAQGRYELRTIRPGAYPAGGVAAHIHYIAEGGGYLQQSFELQFEGDPELEDWQLERARDLGRFSPIRPAEKDADGVLHVVHDLRLRE